MKCSLGISNFLFHEIFKFNIQRAEQEINLEFTFISPLRGSPFYTQRVPLSCAFELLDGPANSPAVFSPCLLLSLNHPQLCRCNDFFFSERKSDHVVFFFNDSCLGQSPKSSAPCPLPGFHPSVMCVPGPGPATQSESEVTRSCPTLCNPMSMGFSRQEYWRGLPFPFPEDLHNTGIKPRSPALQADSLLSEPPGVPSPQISLQALALSWNSSLLSASLTLPFYLPFETNLISTSS